MDSFNLSLDQLAKETFELTGQLSFADVQPSSGDDLTLWDKENRSQEQEPVAVSESLPKAPGLIYKVDKTSGTFCIRALASENIKSDYDSLLNLDQQLLKKMKLESLAPEEKLSYFETSSLERAEIIYDQMANRRFPLDEDVLCNISDPGFSWWMSISEGSFHIYFNSHGLNRAERFVQLGPLGDGNIAALRFRQLETYLLKSFPLAEFSISEKAVHITCDTPDSRNFYTFQSIFLDGINEKPLEDFQHLKNGTTLYYYLKEISDMRRFWLQLELDYQSAVSG